MFYDLFCQLCEKKGVSVTRATVEMGLSRTIGSKWKRTGATPNGETLNRIAEYFGVTTDYLLTGRPLNPPDQQAVSRILLHSLDQAQGQLRSRRNEPLSRQELAALFAAMLLEP